MSVDARELRIGNWIYCFNPNEKGYSHNLTTQVTLQHFKLMRDEGNFNDYSPIPLTKEIIEKCGGEYSMGENYSMGEKFRILFAAQGITLVFFDRSLRGKVDYVHQLQNLIYALTGTEINLTL